MGEDADNKIPTTTGDGENGAWDENKEGNRHQSRERRERSKDPRDRNNPYCAKIPDYYREQQISRRRIRNEAKFVELLKEKYGQHYYAWMIGDTYFIWTCHDPLEFDEYKNC